MSKKLFFTQRWCKLKEIHNQMKKDIARNEQKDKELMDFIKANPGGMWDGLVEQG